MFDAQPPGREPDALLYAPEHDRGLWRLPWIAAAQIRQNEDGSPDETLVALWFQESEALPDPQAVPAPASWPDRPHDLEVHNAGHAPPEGFWRVHPSLEAYAVEYDPDDGGNWWAKLWLRRP